MTDQTQGAPTETPAAGESLPSASEIMAFDPFAPAEKPEQVPETTSAKPADDKSTQSPPTSGAPVLKAGEKPPAGEAPIDPNAAKAPPATTPAAPNYEQLIREQTAQITAALAPKEPTDKTPPPPKYNLALPPQVLGLLRSEDPGEFATGMHAVINGISNKIWADVEAHITEFRDKILREEMPRLLTQQNEETRTQEDVAKDFYGAHPSLNNPILKQLIQTIGMQVVQARQSAGKSVAWGPELRDEIAEAVYTGLPQLRPVAQPGGKVPVGQQPKKLPFVAGSNARPGNAPDPTSEFAELLQ